MKAKELRIGNLVLKEGVIHPIGFYDFENGGANFVVDDYQPIPLTEEWLLKFGFEKNEEEIIFEGLKLWWSDNDGMKSYYHINSELLIYIDHVHQLQNLYFALTGEELEQ